MKQLIHLLLILSLAQYSFSQSTWEYYANDNWIQDIQVIDNNVWIANPTGLHILDLESGKGKLLQSINSPLRGNFAYEILPLEDHVWVAFEEGGLARYQKETETNDGYWKHYYTPIEGDEDILYRANNMMEDKNGTLWFDRLSYGKGHLYALKDEVLFDYSNYLPETPYFITCHGSQNIYFRTDQDNLFVFDVTTETPHSISLPTSTSDVYWFTAFKDDLYVSIEDGNKNYMYRYDGEWHLLGETEEPLYLYKVNKGEDRMWYYSYTEDPYFIAFEQNEMQYYTFKDLVGDQVVPGLRTIVMNEDKEGRIWFYTYNDYDENDIVYSIDNGKVKSYSVHHSFLRNIPNSGGQSFDCEGNLIIPSLTEVQVFNPDSLNLKKILPNRDKGDLEFSGVNPLTCKYYVARDGFISEPSVLYVFEDHELIDTIVLPGKGITAFHISSQGIIYAGLGLNGIGIYDEIENNWTIVSVPFYNPEFSRNNIIYEIIESPTGNIVIGTSRSLVIFDGEEWTTYDKTNSPIGDKSVHSLCTDREGNILFGYNGGIYKYNGDVWKYYTFYDPYENSISSIKQDKYGNFWLGTSRSGLLYWNGYDYQQFDIKNSAIPSNGITEILIHPHTEDIWLFTLRGIVVFDPDNGLLNKGIFGKAFYDVSQDMSFDPGVDIGLKGVKVSLDEDISVITDAKGNYGIYPDDFREYNLDCTPPNDYTYTTPSSISTTYLGENIEDLNFGLWKSLEDTDLELDISLSPFLCSSEISTWITIDNPGIKAVSGQVTLSLPKEIKILATYPEAEILSDYSVRWEFSDLSFLEQRSYYAIIEGPATEDVIFYKDSLDQILIPITTNIEYDGMIKEVMHEEEFVCDYDPNDKLSNSIGQSVDNLSLLEDELEFTIRFQNEGYFKATNIILIDTLDSQLDMESLIVISSSHPVQTQLNNPNELIFRFLGINLPPKSENEAGSQGFVKYRIKAKEDLPDFSVIQNKADIYFDSNSPFRTNTTENILVGRLPKYDFIETDLFGVYPNPSRGQFTIEPNFQEEYDIEICNVLGIVLLRMFDQTGISDLYLYEPGIYFLRVNQGLRKQAKKIIVH